MKTYLTYGFAMAFVGALMNFAFYFTGYHSDPVKLATAQTIGMVIGIASSVTCIVLGTRARRSELPITEGFGYGSAFFTGFMITLFAALFTIATNYLYIQVINPGFMDTVTQMQVQKWEAAGMNPTQIEQAENMMRKMMNPVMQSVFAFFGTLVFGPSSRSSPERFSNAKRARPRSPSDRFSSRKTRGLSAPRFF